MNRFIETIGSVGKKVEPVVLDVAEVALETAIPETRAPIEELQKLISAKGVKEMDFESLGIMMALSALNTFVKNPTTNAKVNAQIATACTDVLESMGYTVTEPTAPAAAAPAATAAKA